VNENPQQTEAENRQTECAVSDGAVHYGADHMNSVSTATTEWRPESPLMEDGQSFTASTARVSVKLLAPFVGAAQELGLRVDVGLAGVGLSRSDLENPARESRARRSVAARCACSKR
jgi:hypothetical protein